ncbi:DUF2267 domain-containing protein [Microbispora sp. KK1-11]|nr:DUF2267 domain-containing protein [Microbispora sp. KK1-11]TQS23123.1 DUF2267 domain-containing protein [Microbispora sp. KK1-11]
MTPPMLGRVAQPPHAAAVFATLREAITDKEFFDITVQLPDEYWTLLPRP